MGLLDEINANRQRTGTTCSVETVMAALDKKDRADLEAALADFGVTGSAIARALQARGHKVTQHTIQRHRRKDCTCGARG